MAGVLLPPYGSLVGPPTAVPTVRGASGEIVFAFVLWYIVVWSIADALLGFLWLVTGPASAPAVKE
jgi:hypothetical protein